MKKKLVGIIIIIVLFSSTCFANEKDIPVVHTDSTTPDISIVSSN